MHEQNTIYSAFVQAIDFLSQNLHFADDMYLSDKEPASAGIGAALQRAANTQSKLKSTFDDIVIAIRALPAERISDLSLHSKHPMYFLHHMLGNDTKGSLSTEAALNAAKSFNWRRTNHAELQFIVTWDIPVSTDDFIRGILTSSEMNRPVIIQGIRLWLHSRGIMDGYRRPNTDHALEIHENRLHVRSAFRLDQDL